MNTKFSGSEIKYRLGPLLCHAALLLDVGDEKEVCIKGYLSSRYFLFYFHSCVYGHVFVQFCVSYRTELFWIVECVPVQLRPIRLGLGELAYVAPRASFPLLFSQVLSFLMPQLDPFPILTRKKIYTPKTLLHSGKNKTKTKRELNLPC